MLAASGDLDQPADLPTEYLLWLLGYLLPAAACCKPASLYLLATLFKTPL